MKTIRKRFLLMGTALVCCALICGCGKAPEPTTPPTFPAPELVLPWENGGKQPAEYSWEEFEALSGQLQIAFQNAMGTEAFEAWMAQDTAQPSPWEEAGAKQPEEYSWEEFEALSGGHQMAFQNALGAEAFEAWMNQAQSQTAEHPWEEDGAKQLEEYTWEEFEALSGGHQMAFQNALGAEAFEAWMNQAQTPPAEHPWDEPGAKQPEEYSWEEFEALSGEHQMAFQNTLGAEVFEAWMTQAAP